MNLLNFFRKDDKFNHRDLILLKLIVWRFRLHDFLVLNQMFDKKLPRMQKVEAHDINTTLSAIIAWIDGMQNQHSAEAEILINFADQLHEIRSLITGYNQDPTQIDNLILLYRKMYELNHQI